MLGKPLLQVGFAIGNLRRFDFRRHCSENGDWSHGFEVWMLSQLRRRVGYNATDGGFQGESQKLGRDIYSSHLIDRYRA